MLCFCNGFFFYVTVGEQGVLAMLGRPTATMLPPGPLKGQLISLFFLISFSFLSAFIPWFLLSFLSVFCEQTSYYCMC